MAPPTVSVTVDPASAEPVSVGVALLLSAAEVTRGLAGGTVSTVALVESAVVVVPVPFCALTETLRLEASIAPAVIV